MNTRRLKFEIKRKLSNPHLWTFIGIAVIVTIVFIKIYLQHHIKHDAGVFHNPIFRTPQKYHTDYLHEWSSPPIVVAADLTLPGEMGKGVDTPKDEEELQKKRFHEHEFNIMASDKVSLNRSLPDMRDEPCKHIRYPKKLPNTSVIIIFHNEAWSTLIRTLWSIINRSPRALVKEIVLVDDASEKPYLGKQLEDYIKHLPIKVILLRQKPRAGLIKARLLGAGQAQGQVLTFLDAHCECAEGWLEPLLTRVAHNRYSVPSPTIGIISDDTFSFHKATIANWGGFSSQFVFKWVPVPQREWNRVNKERTDALRQPTMAGGLFSIDRSFFYEIGSYDDGMRIWGGENIEMSFRVWMCGGLLEILPCSHVGHVFRKETPYKFPGGVGETISYNVVRMAKVWIDDFENYYFQVNPGGLMLYDKHGDVSSRKELRKKLQCKSFQWYLDNVYPEHELPISYKFLGALRNVETNECIDTMGRQMSAQMLSCHNLGGNQLWIMTKHGEIKNDDDCLDGPTVDGPIILLKCHGQKGNQQWVYVEETSIIKHSSGQCLTRPSMYKSPPLLSPCDGSDGQKWRIESVADMVNKYISKL